MHSENKVPIRGIGIGINDMIIYCNDFYLGFLDENLNPINNLIEFEENGKIKQKEEPIKIKARNPNTCNEFFKSRLSMEQSITFANK